MTAEAAGAGLALKRMRGALEKAHQIEMEFMRQAHFWEKCEACQALSTPPAQEEAQAVALLELLEASDDLGGLPESWERQIRAIKTCRALGLGKDVS